MRKLKLPDVTLFTFCWGTEHVAKSLRAMLICLDRVTFGRRVLITDPSKTDLRLFEKFIDMHDVDVCDMRVDLNGNLQDDDKNRAGFCESFVQQTAQHITGDYCLNVQHDSTIIDTSKWDSKFLNYDYIGAPWPEHIVNASDMVAGKVKVKNYVGNGGFSLRTRKFVEESVKIPGIWEHKNEDLHLCVYNYDHMVDKGIKYAPPHLAVKFSVEHPTPWHMYARSLLFTYGSFGFHGEFNTAGMDFIEQYQEKQ